MYSSILDSTPRINQGQENILINLSLPKVENGLLVTTLIDGKCKTQSDPRRRLQFGIAVCRLVFDFTVVTATLLLITAGHGTVRNKKNMFSAMTVSGKTSLTFTLSLVVVAFFIRVDTAVMVTAPYFYIFIDI